jgi:putative tryptophan/tyrosine transport system substrate-binding protein
MTARCRHACGCAIWPFGWLFAVEARRRVGALVKATEYDPRFQAIAGPFQEGLATFGWVEGRNLRIDYRVAGGDPNRLAA